MLGGLPVTTCLLTATLAICCLCVLLKAIVLLDCAMHLRGHMQHTVRMTEQFHAAACRGSIRVELKEPFWGRASLAGYQRHDSFSWAASAWHQQQVHLASRADKKIVLQEVGKGMCIRHPS